MLIEKEILDENDTKTLVAKLEDLIKSGTDNKYGLDEFKLEPYDRLPEKNARLLKDIFLNYFAQKIYPNLFKWIRHSIIDDSNIDAYWDFYSMHLILLDCIKYAIPFEFYTYENMDTDDKTYSLKIDHEAISKLLEAVWNDYNDKDNILIDFGNQIKNLNYLLAIYDDENKRFREREEAEHTASVS